jgi:hypothetical protein
MSTEHRIVLVDAHIIAQFNNVGWWTCSKADNNDESDFAMWAFSQANLGKAHNLIGDCPLVQAPLEYRVKQHTDNGWYIHRGASVDVKAYGSQNEALRNLARSI